MEHILDINASDYSRLFLFVENAANEFCEACIIFVFYTIMYKIRINVRYEALLSPTMSIKKIICF